MRIPKTASARNQRSGLEITSTETIPLSTRHATRAEIASLPRHILGGICFDVAAAADLPLLHVLARPLGSCEAEVWDSATAVETFASGAIYGARNEQILFGTISAPQGDLAANAREMYRAIIRLVRENGYPHLLRLWNHIEGINRELDGLEHYKRFCVGRAEAFAEAGYANGDLPAASGVGMSGGGLAIAFMASRTPGIHVENPRQVSAYDYPVIYSPRSPSFARATVAQFGDTAMIFVSGTSSVVGHDTVHHGNVNAQLDETIRNLDEVIACAAARIGRSAKFEDSSTAKLYMRNAGDAAAITSRLRNEYPEISLLVVEADICRADLLLEIEAVVVLS
jgi:chorismate lyase/3-hydroxybenzoate synthase